MTWVVWSDVALATVNPAKNLDYNFSKLFYKAMQCQYFPCSLMLPLLPAGLGHHEHDGGGVGVPGSQLTILFPPSQ